MVLPFQSIHLTSQWSQQTCTDLSLELADLSTGAAPVSRSHKASLALRWLLLMWCRWLPESTVLVVGRNTQSTVLPRELVVSFWSRSEPQYPHTVFWGARQWFFKLLVWALTIYLPFQIGILLCCVSETKSCSVLETGLDLERILLPLPSQCRDYIVQHSAQL